MRAVMTLLSVLVLVTLSGPILNYTLNLLQREDSLLRQLALLTPASWVTFLEQVYPSPVKDEQIMPRFWGLAGVVLLYGGTAFGLRWWILSTADTFLGRVRDGEQNPPQAEEEETPGVILSIARTP